VGVSKARSTRYGIEYVGEVVESRPLTPTTHHIAVERHPDFHYEPVQYTFLSLRTDEHDSFDDYRPMSLASSPTREHLGYGVRLSDTAWKRAFQALEPGDEVMVEGAVGHFILDEERPAVLIAGGIGITPLKGMAEYAADRKLSIDVRLVYTNRDRYEIAYRDELDELAQANARMRIVHTLTREPGDSEWKGRRGRIDAALLSQMARDLERPRYYVCGTAGMVTDMVHVLLQLGVAADDVLYEEFWGY